MKLLTRSFATLAAFVVAIGFVSSQVRANPPPPAPTAAFGIDPGTSTPLGISGDSARPERWNLRLHVYRYQRAMPWTTRFSLAYASTHHLIPIRSHGATRWR